MALCYSHNDISHFARLKTARKWCSFELCYEMSKQICHGITTLPPEPTPNKAVITQQGHSWASPLESVTMRPKSIRKTGNKLGFETPSSSPVLNMSLFEGIFFPPWYFFLKTRLSIIQKVINYWEKQRIFFLSCVACTRDLFSLVFLEEETVYQIKFSSSQKSLNSNLSLNVTLSLL